MADAATMIIALRAQDDASKALKAVAESIKKTGNHAGKANKPLSIMGMTMDGMLKKGALAATGALVGFVAAGVKSVLSASDVAESQNKVNVVFGESAQVINSFASTSARSLGISRGAALDAAGTFGNMFDQLGISSDATADMSKSMITLAADLGSFNNADITDVIQAQTAAFRGEFDSVQAFVPTINAAAVATEAMAMSGKANEKQLTAQDKALAVHKLLLEGAGKAMGDFPNTANGMANSMKIIKSTIEDATVAVGDRLLPILQPLIVAFAEWLPGAIDAAIGKFDALVKVFGGLKALFTDGDFTGGLRTGLQEFAGITIEEDSGIITGLFLVRNTVLFLKDEAIPGVAGAFNDAKVFVNEHESAYVALGAAVAFVGGPLALGAVTTAMGTVIGAIKGTAAALVVLTPALLSFAGVGLIFAGVGLLAMAFATDFGGVATTVNQMHELMKLGARNWWKAQTDAFDGVKTEFATFGQNTETIGQAIGAVFVALSTGVHNNFVVPMDNAIRAVWGWLQGFGEDVKGLFNGLVDSIANVVPQFVAIGGDIIQGLWNGVSGAWTGFNSWLQGLWQSIPQGLRDWIEGNSPSEVFKEIGEDIPLGLAIGIENGYSRVQSAMAGLVGMVVPPSSFNVKDIWQSRMDAQKNMYAAGSMMPKDLLAPFAHAGALQQQSSMLTIANRAGRRPQRGGGGSNQSTLSYLGGVASILGIGGTVRSNTEGNFLANIDKKLGTANETQLILIDLLQAIKDGALTVEGVASRTGTVQQRRSRLMASFGGHTD